MKDTAPKWQGVIAVSALFGVIAACVAWVIYEYGFGGGFLIGLLVALIVAILLWLGWRDPNPEQMKSGVSGTSGNMTAAGVAGGAAAAAGVAGAASGAAGTSASMASGAAGTASVSTSGAIGGGAGDSAAIAAAASKQAEADAAKAGADAAAKAKADAAKKAEADAAKAAKKAEADAAKAAKAEAAAAKKAADEAAKAEKAKAAAAKKAEAAAAKPSKAATAGTKKAAAKTAAAGTAGAAGTATAAKAASGAGKKPKVMKKARAGGADDLKRIRGVGPKMESNLNNMGYYHFDQVAAWNDEEVEWVDGNMEGFPGRVSRDRWVPQAKLLASGKNVSPEVLDQIKAGKQVDLTDYDGDGVSEGAGEGTRPAALDGPRGGKADNLKEIKGVGPKMEKLCNSLGFYHFDQIAAWKPDEVAWVDANLEGFKGRVTRDTWVAQAKILAAGGETEFSKKVEKGGVY